MDSHPRPYFVLVVILGLVTAGSVMILAGGHAIDEYHAAYADECTRHDVTYVGWDARIHASLWIPRAPRPEYPAVVVSHGLSSSNDVMLPFLVEFCRAGYVVLGPDLRGHGDSTGYCSAGRKEAVDIIAGMSFLRTTVPARFAVNISAVGLVGHSLGSISILKAAMIAEQTSVVNVVLGHPADVENLIKDVVLIEFEDIFASIAAENDFSAPGYLANLSSRYYAANRSHASDPRPYNLLFLHGTEDVTANVSHPWELFKVLAGTTNPDTNVTYGCFAQNNATKFLLYEGIDHAGEQDYPPLIRDAINWVDEVMQPGAPRVTETSFLDYGATKTGWNVVQGGAVLLYVALWLGVVAWFVRRTATGKAKPPASLPGPSQASSPASPSPVSTPHASPASPPTSKVPGGGLLAGARGRLVAVVSVILVAHLLAGLTFSSLASSLQWVPYTILKPFVHIFAILLPVQVAALGILQMRHPQTTPPSSPVARDPRSVALVLTAGVFLAVFLPVTLNLLADAYHKLVFVHWIREPGYAVLAFPLLIAFFWVSDRLAGGLLPAPEWGAPRAVRARALLQALLYGTGFTILFACTTLGQARLRFGPTLVPAFLLAGLAFGIVMGVLPLLHGILYRLTGSRVVGPVLTGIGLGWVLATVVPIF